VLRAEIGALVDGFKDTPGLLMWLLGNENNYGLEWESAAIANLPVEQKQDARAEALYSLFGDVIADIKKKDPSHPIGRTLAFRPTEPSVHCGSRTRIVESSRRSWIFDSIRRRRSRKSPVRLGLQL